MIYSFVMNGFFKICFVIICILFSRTVNIVKQIALSDHLF